LDYNVGSPHLKAKRGHLNRLMEEGTWLAGNSIGRAKRHIVAKMEGRYG
jgi:hypothetical protein